MFEPAAVLASAFARPSRRRLPAWSTASATPTTAPTLRAMAQLAVERISSSDALYHDVQHTMMVTLVGQTILRGRIMVEEVTPEDWLHFTVATLCHDLGYLRGICPGDRDGRYVIDARRHHGRGAARRLGCLPGTLPYRARQALRPPPLPADQRISTPSGSPGRSS